MNKQRMNSNNCQLKLQMIEAEFSESRCWIAVRRNDKNGNRLPLVTANRRFAIYETGYKFSTANKRNRNRLSHEQRGFIVMLKYLKWITILFNGFFTCIRTMWRWFLLAFLLIEFDVCLQRSRIIVNICSGQIIFKDFCGEKDVINTNLDK